MMLVHIVLAQSAASGFAASTSNVNSVSYDFNQGEDFKIRLTYRNIANGSSFSANPGAGAFLT